MTTPLVFLSGAGLPAWVWDDVRSRLDAPTTVARYAKGGARLTQVVDGVVADLPDAPCHLVAHSIGGVVAAGVLGRAPERIAAVTAVCAIVPAAGDSFTDALPAPQRYVMGAMVRLLGTRPPASVLRAQLTAALPDDVADRVVSDFEPESRRLYLDRVPDHAWPADRAYLLTTEDREFPVPLQRRYAARVGADPTTVAAGHLPMLSHPAEVASAVSRATHPA
ncbi:alpha/beta fold hydrolase [Nocardioides coralli]|uniref:alpha/beta fold hydrolase n=1 Tax=Nocardioides coralli TaxID=2872154 RepID=UPI001CA43461|nr:alpha/beta hydrolase [Nocardioides coralli]QZY29468.1 alpha/beta hydrolase [Nocardioides coralli]